MHAKFYIQKISKIGKNNQGSVKRVVYLKFRRVKGIIPLLKVNKKDSFSEETTL